MAVDIVFHHFPHDQLINHTRQGHNTQMQMFIAVTRHLVWASETLTHKRFSILGTEDRTLHTSAQQFPQEIILLKTVNI